MVTEADLCAEALLQALLQGGHNGRRRGPRSFRRRFLGRAGSCSAATSASVWRTLRDFFRTRSAASRCSSGEARPSRTLAWPTESVLAQMGLQIGAEFQEAQGVWR